MNISSLKRTFQCLNIYNLVNRNCINPFWRFLFYRLKESDIMDFQTSGGGVSCFLVWKNRHRLPKHSKSYLSPTLSWSHLFILLDWVHALIFYIILHSLCIKLVYHYSEKGQILLRTLFTPPPPSPHQNSRVVNWDIIQKVCHYKNSAFGNAKLAIGITLE